MAGQTREEDTARVLVILTELGKATPALILHVMKTRGDPALLRWNGRVSEKKQLGGILLALCGRGLADRIAHGIYTATGGEALT